MDLIGRARELAALERLADAAEQGFGGTIVFVGPAGAGKRALAQAVAAAARRRGFELVRAEALAQAGPPLLARLVQQVVPIDEQLPGPSGDSLAWSPRLDAGASADARSGDAVDRAARLLTSGPPRMLLVEAVQRGGPEAVELLAALTSFATTSRTMVVATSEHPLGFGDELRLRPLSDDELAQLAGPLPAELRHAVGVASGSWPGAARQLLDELRLGEPAVAGRGLDPVVHVALGAESTEPFHDLDVELVRLIETALARVGSDERSRARLLARLAYELRGDPSAAERRERLVEEALLPARRLGDPQVMGEVLDAQLHAQWDPAAAPGRLQTASAIVDLARAGGDRDLELRGLHWRFLALLELGEVDDAESALALFERTGVAAGDEVAAVVSLGRYAMLAILRGRFEDADRLTTAMVAEGRRVGFTDTEGLAVTLRGAVAAECAGLEDVTTLVAAVLTTARSRPGLFLEATAARLALSAGQTTAARTELERVLTRVLEGTGPRWLAAVADLAVVAAASGDRSAATRLRDALLPYRGRLVLFGRANFVYGPAARYLGLLDTALGHHDDAVALLQEAAAIEERIGALPGLVHTLVGLATALETRRSDGDHARAVEARDRAASLAGRLGMNPVLVGLGVPPGAPPAAGAPPPATWTMRQEGETWLLAAGSEEIRLRDRRGLHYLRALLAAPGQEVAALDLVAGGAGLRAPDDAPTLDADARSAYRRRLEQLAGELDDADAAGDAERSEQTLRERQAIVDELRRARGLGGRPRRGSTEAERARVNVTRTLRATLERIADAAPRLGAHLQASVRTGHACRYQPDPSGPGRWQV